jgi:hypothetical protein
LSGSAAKIGDSPGGGGVVRLLRIKASVASMLLASISLSSSARKTAACGEYSYWPSSFFDSGAKSWLHVVSPADTTKRVIWNEYSRHVLQMLLSPKPSGCAAITQRTEQAARAISAGSAAAKARAVPYWAQVRDAGGNLDQRTDGCA